MYIIKTPFRLSFFGGGTDFETYFSQYGGSVISTTIDKYCYVTVRNLPPFFDYENQVTYSKVERFNDAQEVEHPLVREALKFKPVDRIQIAYDADLPACSGIGSSSSFAVGLLKGLNAMRGNFPNKREIANEAIFLERKLCKEYGGIQDQIAASFGGFNRIDFNKNGFSIRPIEISSENKRKLSNNLLLAFTGFTRYATDVSMDQEKSISKSLEYLNEMKKITDEAEELLRTGNIDDFGRLLNKTWEYKKKLSDKISNSEIDRLYDIALNSGAYGAKIIGAGGGGFMLIYAPKENHSKIKNALNDLTFFNVEFEDKGSVFIENL